MKRLTLAVLALAALFAALVSTGCATKKYVHETMVPVQQKVADLDKKNAEQDTAIAELGRGVSRADERAQGADSKAGDAAREAARANDQAATASKQAGAAQSTADKGVAQAAQAERSVGTLGTKVENMDNYKLATTETILFAVGKSELSKEAQAQLDAFAAKVAPLKHYTIDVQGFTDSTGGPAANVELSRRRAAAVVRYLTLDRKLPLFRVNTIGYGKESPAADNKTRDGRKQNRRVEVHLFAPDLGS